MAQQDAMEQVKEFLRQVIRYRFWISVGLAALFALIAYLVGSGPVRAKAADETKKITGALTDVKQYISTAIPTADYKPIVDEKTDILGKDVKSAWKTLYDRQAPLLTWPETVQERFRKWGRQWPKEEDSGRVTLAIVDYIMAYPEYVSMVYKTCNPFDYETGKGIIVAPPQEALLRPSAFQVEHVPNLGKVWSAQERLWMQRTVLDVIAQVNKSAKNWDDATVKQILVLEVGNPRAQDQRSMAKGEQLEESAAIYAPGEEEAAQAATSSAPTSGAAGMAQQMMGMKGGGGGMMGNSMMGMMAGGGGQVAGGEPENVYYVKYENDKGQYKILPIMVTVLIDQDHIQDFLVELENSPMSIQVMDIDLHRPETRVTKPEKGDVAAGGFGMGMGMGGGGMMSMMMRMGGGQMMGAGRGMMSGYGGMQSQMAMMMGQMRGRMGDTGVGTTAARKGTDVRSVDRAKTRKEKEKAAEQVKGPTLFDPHFDIIEVTVYGQARFFNPPPADEQAEPSLGESATAAGAAASATPAASTKPAPAAAPTTGSPSPAASGAPGAATAETQKKPAASQPAAATGKAETVAPAAKGEASKAETSKPDATKGDAKNAIPKS